MDTLDNDQINERSIGSPLLNKKDDSLSYESVLQYMNTSFKNSNLLRLDYKVGGSKRRSYSNGLDITTYTNENNHEVFWPKQKEENQNILKKAKYSRLDNHLTPEKLSPEQNSNTHYIQICNFDRSIRYKHINIEPLRNRLQEMEHITYTDALGTCHNEKNGPKKRNYIDTFGGESMSEQSTDLDSPLHSSIVKRSKLNNFEVMKSSLFPFYFLESNYV